MTGFLAFVVPAVVTKTGRSLLDWLHASLLNGGW